MRESSNSSKQSKSYTVKEVASILSAIQGRILSIHRCSSDDFLGLNSDFKRYYVISKEISSNANRIFQSLSESNEHNLFAELNSIYLELRHVGELYSSRGRSTQALLSRIQTLLNNLFLPIKNLGQDLMSIKLLVTNLHLPDAAGTPNSISGATAELNQVIDAFKLQLVTIEKNLLGLRSQIDEELECFKCKHASASNELDATIDSIHLAILFFAEKHQEVALELPNLSSKIESTTRSLDQIIIGLQYHDIIRQKIEHVQTSQQEVLNNIERNGWGSSSKNLDQFIMQIRDIVNLHSAQLLRANKEYQQAIEVIAAEFIGIETQMNAIASMCQTISSNQKSEDDLYLSRIINTLNNSILTMGVMDSIDQSPFCQMDWVNGSVAQSIRGISKVHHSIANLKIQIGKLIRITSGEEFQNTPAKRTTEQISSLINEMERFDKVMQQCIHPLEQHSTTPPEWPGHEQSSSEQKEALAGLCHRLNSIIDQLCGQNSQMSILLTNNKQLSQNISNEIRNSIRGIKYYDFFDRVIVDIISELNQIYRKLTLLVGEHGNPTVGSLDSVSKLYTMASEHDVHQQVLGNIPVDTESDENYDPANDDNVKFF